MYPTLKSPSHAFWRSRARPILDHGYPSMMYISLWGRAFASLCVHGTRSYAQIMHLISQCQHPRISGAIVLAVLLFFFKTQLLSNGLVNMSLLACHKLECTDKATVTYWSVRSSLQSREPFFCARSLLLSFLSISFSLANFGSDILVLGPFFPTSRSPLTLVIWFEHAQIIGKEVWYNREHVLFSRTCSVSQTGHTDRWTSVERSDVGFVHARLRLFWIMFMSACFKLWDYPAQKVSISSSSSQILHFVGLMLLEYIPAQKNTK